MSSTINPSFRLTYHLLGIACVLYISGCVQAARPVIKIGLVAPFEGRYREVGYQALHAVRLAVRQANAASGISGYWVELVALDDGGDPSYAREQAEKLITDPMVVGVIGHWLDHTTTIAAPIYANAGLPMLATSSALDLPVSSTGVFRLFPTHRMISRAMARTAVEAGGGTTCLCGVVEGVGWLETHPNRPAVGGPLWGLQQFHNLTKGEADMRFVTPAPMPYDAIGGEDFADRYRDITDGAEPGWVAVLAHDAAQSLLAAIAASPEYPTAPAVAASLAHGSVAGLAGQISFDTHGNWRTPHLSVYRWEDGQIVR